MHDCRSGKTITVRVQPGSIEQIATGTEDIIDELSDDSSEVLLTDRTLHSLGITTTSSEDPGTSADMARCQHTVATHLA